VILDHVTDEAGLVVVPSSAFHTNGFRDGNLDMIDIVLVPDRLQHAISKTEHQHILHCLFAQIVIDAVDLVFVEMHLNGAIEQAGGIEIMTKGLFDNHAAPSSPPLCRTPESYRHSPTVPPQEGKPRGAWPDNRGDCPACDVTK